MTEIQAIPTDWKGVQFRSRLEARWAIFFEGIGMSWKYEARRFEVDGIPYTPDFTLSEPVFYVEIKPNLEALGLRQSRALESLRKDGHRIMILIGNPWPWEYTAYFTCSGLLVKQAGVQFARCELCGRVALMSRSNRSYQPLGGGRADCAHQFKKARVPVNGSELLESAYRRARFWDFGPPTLGPTLDKILDDLMERRLRDPAPKERVP